MGIITFNILLFNILLKNYISLSLCSKLLFEIEISFNVLSLCDFTGNILSVDFRVYQYQPSGNKARTSLNNVMSQRICLRYLQTLASVQYFIFQPICSILCLCALFFLCTEQNSLMRTYALRNIYVIFERDRSFLPSAMCSKMCIIAF